MLRTLTLAHPPNHPLRYRHFVGQFWPIRLIILILTSFISYHFIFFGSTTRAFISINIWVIIWKRKNLKKERPLLCFIVKWSKKNKLHVKTIIVFVFVSYQYKHYNNKNPISRILSLSASNFAYKQHSPFFCCMEPNF